MFQRLQRTTAAFLILPSLAVAASGINRVTSIRSWSHVDSTRVVIETSGLVDFKADRAINPDRLFFDLAHAIPSIDHKRYATHSINDKLVTRVRIAETSPTSSRIVFDLTGPGLFRVSRLEAPDRIVIEVRPPNTPVQISRLPVSPAYSQRAFLYPPRQSMPRIRSVFLAGQPPSFEPLKPASPNLPDPALFLASLTPPRRTRTTSKPAVVVASSTKVLASQAPFPYDSTPHESENASRSLTRALGLKVNRIVIDAGHGGHDEGTRGPDGILEKDVVLDVALRLATLVQTRMGAEVVLTRSDDTFIPLRERTAIANSHKADLFLSIHANSSPSPVVAGTETFFLNFSNSTADTNVAARENAGADKTVGELRDLIQSITLNDKIAESQTFAQSIQNSIFTQAFKSNALAHNRGVKRAPFVVLIGASMPSVLAEIGFLTNAKDESNLAKPEYRQKVAEALFKGLSEYSQSLSHFDMAKSSDKSADKPGGKAVAGLN